MKTSRHFILLSFLLFTLSTAAQTRELSPGLDQYIESTMQEFNIPGLAMAVVNKDGIVWAHGFGYRDVENQLAVDNDTLFAIGSTTKAFTATGVGILVDRQQVRWHERVRTYLPEFQLFDELTSQLATPRDLLGHTTGLPRHDLAWYGSHFTREELYARLRFLEPTVTIRQKWQYQNLMYLVSGILIERVSGKTWEDFTRTELLQPLGMNRTALNLDEAVQFGNLSQAYSGARGTPAKKIPYRDIKAVAPAGSIHSSLNDMAQWLRLQLAQGQWQGRQLVAAPTLKSIHQATTYVTDGFRAKFPELTDLHYGMGWMSTFYRGERLVFHNGGIDGFVTHVSFMPEENLAIVVFSNNGSFDGLPLALRAYDTLLGHPNSDWVSKLNPPTPARPPLPPSEKLEHPLASFVGEFEHPGYGILRITEVDGKLALLFNELSSPLLHLGQGQFLVEAFDENFPVSFTFDSVGLATEVNWVIEPALGKALVFRRR